jgi:hypothetical protein
MTLATAATNAGQEKKDPADPGSEHCGVFFTWLLVYIGILRCFGLRKTWASRKKRAPMLGVDG